MVTQLSLDRYKATILGLTKFGDRREGTQRNRDAVDWIEAQLKSYGCPTERITYTYTERPPRDTTGRGAGRGAGAGRGRTRWGQHTGAESGQSRLERTATRSARANGRQHRFPQAARPGVACTRHAPVRVG